MSLKFKQNSVFNLAKRSCLVAAIVRQIHIHIQFWR